MQCPRCQTENREGRRFCAECGAPMGAACPACGWINEPGEKYCGGCGSALGRAATSGVSAALATGTAGGVRVPAAPCAAPAGAAGPERRQLTVMFCDLVGSTALSVRLDPEDLRQVIRAYQQACAAVIARFEGVVARYLGDGIMAHFGYPKAHEDDAERAVRAGLEIVEAIARLNTAPARTLGAELAVRIGIATGLVVAGDLIGTGAAEEQVAVGETPNLAARLQGLASPNAVVIAPATQRLLDGLFEYEDLGAHPLKGFAEPIRAWRVLRPRPVRSRFEAVRASALTPLVGREEELELLLRRWEQAKSGEGQVVLLSGDSGVGKSRLVQTLRERIGAEPHIRMRYQCSPYHTNSALYPFIGQLERAAGLRREDTPAQKLDKLEALLARAARRVEEVAPLFAALLSIPAEDRYGPLALSPQQQKTRTLAAFIEQMEGLAATELVLVVFEDAHWMDPTSRELVDLVVERTATARVLVLVTFRADFAPPWIGRAHVTWLALRRLNRRQCARMVEAAAGGKQLPEAVVEEIIAKTDGVPLFVEELTRTVLASGLLHEAGDRYVLNGPLPPLAIPATLQDTLMARLDQLAPVKEVVQIGAVIGREFSLDVLAAVSGFSQQRLEEALAQLVRSEIISRLATAPEAVYAFKHVLVQDAAYQSLLKSRRQQLHARIAQVLEAQFPERAALEPELLALHYTEAGLAEAAVRYWLRAGLRAFERSANLEVVGHMSRGLEVLSTLPDTAERNYRELELHVGLGAAYRAIKGFASPEVEQSFGRAWQLCERAGSIPQRVEVLRGLYACYYVRGDLATARQQAGQVLALAQDAGDVGAQALGRYLLGAILFWQGEFQAARSELERAFALYDPDRRCSHILSAQIDPGASALDHLSWTLWILGYPDLAIRASEGALAMARSLRQPLTLALALAWASWTRSCCGQPAVAGRLGEELKAVAREQGFLYLGTCATFLEGQALLARDQFEAGLARIRRALAEFEAQGAGLGRGWTVAVPAAACVRAGRPEEGLQWLAQGLAAVERSGERQWEAELHRLKGELLLARSASAEVQAEECMRRAAEVARRQGAKSLELRAAMSLARLLRRQGREREARPLLADVYGWFGEGFETADLLAARQLLDALA